MSIMPNPPGKRSSTRAFILFGLLAAVACYAVYQSFQARDWHVPPDAKTLKNPVSATPADLHAAREIYKDKCARCHGDAGKGDGSDARNYDPHPTDFSDAGFMAKESDGELFYKLGAGKRPMPSFKGRLTEYQRWQMVTLLRSFASSPGERQP